jgi:hypothetical protein
LALWARGKIASTQAERAINRLSDGGTGTPHTKLADDSRPGTLKVDEKMHADLSKL